MMSVICHIEKKVETKLLCCRFIGMHTSEAVKKSTSEDVD
jgi:hypothetical protein